MENDRDKQIQVKNEANKSFPTALSFFSTDEQFVFVFKKIQKLVSALYLITGFFQENEPIKWKLRSLGSELLSASLCLKDGSAVKDKTILSIRNTVLEITALFGVAKQSGMITEMNFEIVNREFSLLLASILLSNESFVPGTSDLNPESLYVPAVAKNQTINRPVSMNLQEDTSLSRASAHITDKTTSDPEDDRSTGLLDEKDYLFKHNSHESHKGHKVETKSISKHDSQDLKEYGIVAVKKNSRQSIIISLLKRKKEIMIKDVSPLIDGCSEKTIQRELLSMVSSGILKKEGEKRWSKYSLARP